MMLERHHVRKHSLTRSTDVSQFVCLEQESKFVAFGREHLTNACILADTGQRVEGAF